MNLKFGEVYVTGAGQRVFNVALNSSAVLTNFDIFAQAGGAFKALDKPFTVTVTNGLINIQFTTGSANLPMINAIEILAVATTTTTTPVTTTPVTTAPVTTAPVTTAPTAPAFSPVLVHAGGGNVVDSLGQTWAADKGFTGGSPWAISNAVTGTATPALYQTCRYGATFSYQFAVPNGTYSVTLKFAEVYATGPGQREFNVAINGAPVLANFDIFAQSGGIFRAVDKTFPVTVTNGLVNIQFTSGAANLPMVNAVEVAAAGSTGGTELTGLQQ